MGTITFTSQRASKRHQLVSQPIGLTLLIHLTSIGHKHFLSRMIRLTRFLHYYSRVLQYRA